MAGWFRRRGDMLQCNIGAGHAGLSSGMTELWRLAVIPCAVQRPSAVRRRHGIGRGFFCFHNQFPDQRRTMKNAAAYPG